MKAVSLALAVAFASVCLAGCGEDKPKATPDKPADTKAPQAASAQAPAAAPAAPSAAAPSQGGW